MPGFLVPQECRASRLGHTVSIAQNKEDLSPAGAGMNQRRSSEGGRAEQSRKKDMPTSLPPDLRLTSWEYEPGLFRFNKGYGYNSIRP